jgi:hypothetical protein
MPHAAVALAAPTDRAASAPASPAATKRRGTPWHAAIAEARAAHRAARIAARSTQCAACAPATVGQTRAAHTNAASSPLAPRLIPVAPYTADSLLERALAARVTGLRAPAIRPSQSAQTPGQVAPFEQSRIDPLNREPMAKPATAPFDPFRIDPLDREPMAMPGSTAPFKQSRIDPLNREPTATPGSTAPFKPFRIDPLNREPAAKPGSTAPSKQSRIDPLNREPMAKPATAPFKPSRIDPLNREPGAVPDPEPRPAHRVHDPVHFRQSTRRTALTAPAPQARKSLPRMNADERR